MPCPANAASPCIMIGTTAGAVVLRAASAWRACGPSPPGRQLPGGWDSRRDGFPLSRPFDSDEIARRAHVVLHVAAAQNAARVHIFEIARRLPQPARPTMCTITFSRPRWLIASIAFSAPCSAAALRIASSSGNRARFAFERISLRAQIARLQDLLENFGADQQIENSRAVRLRRFRFHALLNPQPPLAIRDVHEFRADAAAIDAPRRFRIRALRLQVPAWPRARDRPADRDLPEDIPSGETNPRRAPALLWRLRIPRSPVAGSFRACPWLGFMAFYCTNYSDALASCGAEVRAQFSGQQPSSRRTRTNWPRW